MSGSNVGNLLGGAARSRDRRKTRELESRRLDIVEGQFEANQQADLLQRTREQFAGLTEQAVEIVANMGIGRDDPRFDAAIAPIRTAVATLAARAESSFPGSVSAQTQVGLFDSAVTGTPTITEAAEAEARGNVAGAVATETGLAGAGDTARVAAGVAEPPRSAALQNQVLQASAAAKADPRMIRLQAERDAAEQRGDTRRAVELTNIINKAGTITGTTEFDPSAEGFETALTTPTEDDVERLRTNIRGNQSSFETAANTLAAVEEAGALSVGFAGAAVEGFTGFMGNLGALGDAIKAGVESLTGADLEKLTAARTSMREGVASALPEITEEESGRFTDTERRIANETLRGLTPDADIDQVISAYQTYFRILNTSDVRNTREIMRGAGIDLGTAGALNPDGVNRIGTILRDLGMSEARILEILDQVAPR